MFSCLLLMNLTAATYASKVDTVKVFSPSMQKEIKTVVIIPDSYSKNMEYPVLYLLHGYSDNYGGWVNKVPVVKELADLHNVIIVCPDGATEVGISTVRLILNLSLKHLYRKNWWIG